MILLVLMCCAAAIAQQKNSNLAEVKIQQGILSGEYLKTAKGRTFTSFSGIPYAEPPLGSLRFKVALPAKPWDGIFNATKQHAVCPQKNIFIGDTTIIGNEDCLFLNVYTPQLTFPTNKRLAVMIFFHGHGYLSDDANRNSYDPSVLLDKDIVLVVPNYRLGALGFLSTGDEVVPGNNGLKDQNLAIRWVKDNIDKFGGDCDRITLFGQSAGGASAHFHMLSPLSQDLISGVICESGTALSSWTLAPNNQGLRHSRKLASLLNCPTYPSIDMVACLRKAEANDLIDKADLFYEWGVFPLVPFKPVIEPDIKGAFLNAHPIDIIKRGKIANIPMMTGIVRQDGAFGAAAIFGNATLLMGLKENFSRYAPLTLGYGETSPDEEFVTRNVKQFYLGNDEIDESSRFSIIDMYTDGIFSSASNEAVRLHTKYTVQPVYNYAYGYKSSVSFSSVYGDPSRDYGVCHSDELLSLFKYPKLFPEFQPSSSDKRMMEIMTTLWSNFAKYGNPTPVLDSVITKKWIPVQSESLEYYDIKNDTNIQMASKLYWDRAEFWKELPLKSKNNVIEPILFPIKYFYI